MKSKRVTKLLACALATSMSIGAVPVFATSSATSNSFNMNVGIAGATVNVNVPIAMNIKVNPLHASSGSKIGAYGIASDEFVISNNTATDDGTGVDVMCKAVAQVTAKKEDVQLTYSDFTPNANDKQKKAFIQIAPTTSSTVAISNNDYAAPNTTGNATVTTLKSTYEMKVDGPSSGAAGLGAFAIVGKANVGADWKASDFTVALSYDIKVAPTGATAMSLPAANSISPAVSSNNIQNDITIVGESVLTGAYLNGAKVTHIQIHSPTNALADTLFEANDTRLKITYADDAVTAGTKKCTVAFAGNCKFLQTITSSYKGETFEIVTVLSDGRRLITVLPVAA